MIINAINLERRPDRKLSLIKHLDDMGCGYKFWNAYDDKRPIMPFENISNSHKAIVRDAKANDLPSALIAEDDLRFSCKSSLSFFLDTAPESYHIYFGMIYTGTIHDRRIVQGFSGMQFYSIHNSFYDTFLSIPEKKHLDVWLGQECLKYNFYVCDPFICYGQSGFSDNFNRQWVFDEKKLPRNLLRDETTPI